MSLKHIIIYLDDHKIVLAKGVGVLVLPSQNQWLAVGKGRSSGLKWWIQLSSLYSRQGQGFRWRTITEKLQIYYWREGPWLTRRLYSLLDARGHVYQDWCMLVNTTHTQCCNAGFTVKMHFTQDVFAWFIFFLMHNTYLIEVVNVGVSELHSGIKTCRSVQWAITAQPHSGLNWQ